MAKGIVERVLETGGKPPFGDGITQGVDMTMTIVHMTHKPYKHLLVIGVVDEARKEIAIAMDAEQGEFIVSRIMAMCMEIRRMEAEHEQEKAEEKTKARPSAD